MHALFKIGHRLPLILLPLLPLWLGWVGPDYGTRNEKDTPAMLDGYVVVKFKSSGAAKASSTVFDNASTQLQIDRIRPIFRVSSASSAGKNREITAALSRIHEVRFSANISPRIAAAMLARDPNVEFAEPRYVYPLAEGIESENRRLAPNDPQYTSMDHLRHIGMPEAWDVARASDDDVLIAIVDAGTEWRHPDLSGNIWTNATELAGDGIDNDQNGLVDDVRGWNFADETNDPTGLTETPENGRHGTIVAGIAGAVTDNEMGIAGASWNARILPVNVACPTTDNAVCFGYDGVIYAALQGADVINISWGGPDSFLGREAVRIAAEMQALLVVSAGNNGEGLGEGGNIDTTPAYPALYDGVLVVGATGKNNDTKADFSNYGLSVDVFAPGVSINSIAPDAGYTSDASGTSFATPLVAGLAAILRAQHPNWSVDEIREQIRATSDPIDAVNSAAFNGLLGKGRINAAKAAGEVTSPALRIQDLEFLDSGNDGTIQSGESVELTLTLTNILADASNLSLSLSSTDPRIDLREGRISLGALGAGESTTVRFSFSIAESTPADHPLLLRFQVEGDEYTDVELIRLVANQITHNTGTVEMSLTDEGNIGWADFQASSEGKGFRFLGIDWLFEGGFLVGTREERISDSVRNTGELTQDADLSREADTFFGITPGQVTSEVGLVTLNDSTAADPIGLRIRQESYADSRAENNQFVIIRYTLSHADPSATHIIDNIFAGLFCDWDLTIGGDFARFDANRRMGVVQSSAEEPIVLFGTRMLTNNGNLSYRSIDNSLIFDDRSGGDGFTRTEKWSFLTGGIQTTEVNDADVSTLVAAGPYRIEPGESVEIAYAIVAGLGAEQFLAAADQAQNFWEDTVRNLAPNPVGLDDEVVLEDAHVDAPYPNPARSMITFDVTLPAAGSIELSIYDVLGREIHVMRSDGLGAGLQHIQWNTRNSSGAPVPGGLYLYRIRAMTPHGTRQVTNSFAVTH